MMHTEWLKPPPNVSPWLVYLHGKESSDNQGEIGGRLGERVDVNRHTIISCMFYSLYEWMGYIPSSKFVGKICI